ncbi:MAG: hypothetical protein B6245_08385 [Desulfobacteraceae bacterium 4572_88]|nr:MAG: hypothetical protein B6245_08385 [Desulfobacteraceae bacterium 4572_88]
MTDKKSFEEENDDLFADEELSYADEDEFFADEESSEPSEESGIWKILVADDEEDVHTVTRLAIEDVVFEGKILKIMDARSGAEARQILKENPDTALVLLDVVMESHNAGLDLVRHIREELGNQMIRIVLRTGQAGHAPERKVVVDYDINDYKTKTELTSEKLFTMVISAIRSYQAFHALDAYTRDLEQKVRERTRKLEIQKEESEKLRKKAEAANIAKSTFLANMSHEIRTPMSGVISMTNLLLDTETTLEQREYAEALESSAESLLSVINDILDFSKIEAGKFDFKIIDFDLRHVIDHMLKPLTMEAHMRGLGLACETEPDVPVFVRGDPGRLRQILNNLIGNAMKFTHQGGIVLQVSPEEESDSHVVVRFSVTDTGIGIHKNHLNRLFKAFFQVDMSATRKYGGTGLGLAISKQFAEMMGGQIGVLSEEGKGSTFWFTVRLEKLSHNREAEIVIPGDMVKKRIPTADGNSEPVGHSHLSDSQTASDGAEQHELKILLAEDNIVNQKVAEIMLDKLGYQVDIANDGKEALAALEKSCYDLVLMDIQMPEMSGLEVTRAIRDQKSEVFDHNVPIIAMTAHTMKGDRERFIEAGMNDHVPKPVKPDELDKAIRRQTTLREKKGEIPDEKESETERPKDDVADDRKNIFDRNTLLKRIGGDEGLCEELLNIFPETFNEHLERLRGSLEKNDSELVMFHAHTASAASANIEACALKYSANEMEMAAAAGDMDKARSFMTRLEDEFERLKKKLEDEGKGQRAKG